MPAKFSFQLESSRPRPRLPHKIIVGRDPTETTAHVLLKLLAYLLLHRDRIQLDARMPDENIPFRADVVQLDYALRPVLWVECGDCSLEQLDRLAVKVPEAEIWIMKRSLDEAEALARGMSRMGLRRNRYQVVGLEAATFDEALGLLGPRNRVLWVAGTFDPPQLEFDFNGLWFELPFVVLRY